jgi:hypothetical protein
MPLLSYNQAPAKGSTSVATLNKSAAVALAGSDTYWSEQNNIKTVIVTFKSTTGNQKRTLEFDFTVASPTDDLVFPLRSRDDFTIIKVLLLDYLDDKLSISNPGLVDDDISLSP